MFKLCTSPSPSSPGARHLYSSQAHSSNPLTVVHADAGGWHQLTGQPLWHDKEQLCNKQMSEENEKNKPIDILS